MALNIEADSVRSHLTILQGVISRMAANSASCKTWCVTIVSAMTVLAIDKAKPQALLTGLLPVTLFFCLDAYYLSLERDFREVYNSFVAKVKVDNNDAEKDVYKLSLPKSGFLYRARALGTAILSLAIVPFYGSLAAALVIGRLLLMP